MVIVGYKTRIAVANKATEMERNGGTISCEKKNRREISDYIGLLGGMRMSCVVYKG